MNDISGLSSAGEAVALRDVNLTVEAGEIHAICGENGAGKSTLMKVLSGVYPHGSYEGDIVYQGEVRQFSDIADSEKLGIIIIHQELALVPLLSIAENIFLGHEPSTFGVIDWGTAFSRTRTGSPSPGDALGPVADSFAALMDRAGEGQPWRGSPADHSQAPMPLPPAGYPI